MTILEKVTQATALNDEAGRLLLEGYHEIAAQMYERAAASTLTSAGRQVLLRKAREARAAA